MSMQACDDCLRRTDLLAALAARLDIEWRRRSAPAGVLSLPEEALVALDHPLAEEILSLTEIYLRARFGGELINEESRRSFEDRVKAVRLAAAAQATALRA